MAEMSKFSSAEWILPSCCLLILVGAKRSTQLQTGVRRQASVPAGRM